MIVYIDTNYKMTKNWFNFDKSTQHRESDLKDKYCSSVVISAQKNMIYRVFLEMLT